MRVMICLDDRNGLLFHNRRQSLDREIHRDMVQYATPGDLWMKSYSYKGFTAISEKCHADDDFYSLAKDDDSCFVEDSSILSNLQRFNEIVIYRWNRIYPADVQFPIETLRNWNLVEKVDFSGYSHERITREVYRK